MKAIFHLHFCSAHARSIWKRFIKVLLWISSCAPWPEMMMRGCPSLQRRIEEHWGARCLITTHCIRGIGHRIHPDIRLPVVRWRPGLPLEVACQVWRRPGCALRWNIPANFPSLKRSHRWSWKWPGVGEWHKLCRVGWTRWNYRRAAADPGGKILHSISPFEVNTYELTSSNFFKSRSFSRQTSSWSLENKNQTSQTVKVWNLSIMSLTEKRSPFSLLRLWFSPM